MWMNVGLSGCVCGIIRLETVQQHVQIFFKLFFFLLNHCYKGIFENLWTNVLN